MATRGSYVHNSMEEFSGASRNVSFMQFSQKIDGFRVQTKSFKGLLELLQLIREIFHFHHLPKLYIGFKLLSLSFVNFLKLLLDSKNFLPICESSFLSGHNIRLYRGALIIIMHNSNLNWISSNLILCLITHQLNHWFTNYFLNVYWQNGTLHYAVTFMHWLK